MPVQVVVVDVDQGWGPDPGAVAAALVALAATVPVPLRLVAVSWVEGDLLPAEAPPGVACLSTARLGLSPEDPNLLVAAAAVAGAHARDLLVVAPASSPLLVTAAGVGAAALAFERPWEADVGAVAAQVEAAAVGPPVGVGPHPRPWPDDPRLDPDLLAHGDRRNVVDRYRYWSEAAIVADLDARRHPFHVAVENWQHDLNIGTVVRNANAFGAAGVHIVGQRRWNRRGAMATDRYLPVRHHGSVADFARWAAEAAVAVVGIDNVPGAVDLDRIVLPRQVALVFGQEGPGLSDDMQAVCEQVCAIAQFGSTRSLNAGVASGIAMHVWIRTHVVP